jgi:hypothetical protein
VGKIVAEEARESTGVVCGAVAAGERRKRHREEEDSLHAVGRGP